ncbi:MBL fold metallo-hydrolase RNA specificity domain-containing protein [Ralstonia pseudosolanacearum]|uniref:MBL fold metallo-hydrolase n=1 Tax=Ralstonia solanacearum TaxID=305 RepID=A0AA92JR20_RALSL|nr:MBL fold metallo-hydrolase [Ralstonia pseudosolanacearum]QOK91088.1 MBL fold metallo-hydrolase [Ralstonia pseudosolanacearum]QOK97361.1 MBL fold metallo-hydrolase [Ralstonia pseudosolanacearum]UWD92122.1 MBL fold metallo-hydrolase [Ralstonia pseudosolanacearum]CAH0444071.1 Ribonuclease [Ralstonia pseudosolanacearum]
MRLQFLGATETVTGSKYVLETDGHRVMVDCGLFQGYKSLRLRNWDKLAVNPRHIDAVVLTHAHIDHSGYLPLLVRNGFHGPVYCTKGTAELCNILLPDSARLAVEDAQYANAQGFSRHHPALPLYDENDAAKALRRLHPVAYGERFPVVEGVEAEFHRAGHIIGAATVALLADGQRIVFSGDLGRQTDPVMRPPEPVAEADTLLVESTYGDRLHPAGDPLDTLEHIVQRTIGQGGTLLIPAFAVGRTQALLYCLYTLIRQHRIPHVPIYLDSPMAERATEVFARHIDELHIDGVDCQAACALAIPVQSPQQSMHLGSDRAPKIILAASGMATGGRVLHHLKSFGGGRRNAILMSGFQAAGTRGASLLAGQRQLRVHGREIAIRASVEQIQNLSAHADANELMAWLRGFTHAPQKTFIVHGEPAASDALRQRIEHELQWSVCMPEYRQSYALG